MLDPEGDKNPPIPGDGGAPSGAWVADRLLSDGDWLRDASHEQMLRLLMRVVDAESFRLRGSDDRLLTRAVAAYLGAKQMELIAAHDGPFVIDAELAERALRSVIDDCVRECPVCRDVGVVQRGEPCPTGCAASEQASQEPE